ncbi:hypothetical protein E3P99_03033 [Wallemia hederae]|uniref:NAD(P)-binding protein n=1 Tax=Wallemia hederae TaxID=1540922 RepID=A0A4T0FJV9_9BASI|nr:hypothetical protein E3P99_03033 [Wallemia hederae]
MQIQNNTFIITGGLGGAGTAIAKALINEGGYAVLFDVVEQSAGEQAASKHGSRVKYVKCDITNEEDTRRAVKTASAAFEGKLSGVVHCAGVALAQPWTNRIGDHIQRFKKMIDINTVGTFIVNGLVADAINERYEPEKMAKGEFFTTKEERGVIINFSSVAKDGIARVLCYGPTKAGSHGVGVAMSDFLAPSGIRVNTISPSIINSAMVGEKLGYFMTELAKSASFPQRPIEPEEISDAVLFLVKNGMINGLDLKIDGRWTLMTDRSGDDPRLTLHELQ